MCYSSEASIGAFMFSAILSYILYRRNKNIYRSLLLIFGLSFMQIAEFIMHMDPKCKSNINRYGSILFMSSLLIIQPIFSILAVYHKQRQNIKRNNITNNFMYILYFLYDENIYGLNLLNGVLKRIVLVIVN